MILSFFFLLSLLVSLGIKFRLVKDSFAPLTLIFIYIASLVPSVEIPYIYDDIDHMFTLSRAIDSSTVMSWLFTPHNEHVIPVMKILYYLCYKYFWLFPQPFHIIIFLICIGILYLAYQLLLKLTDSKLLAFVGCSLLTFSNLPDLAIFVITDSHIVFCLFLFILLFYSQYKYFETGEKLWLSSILLSTLLSPMTFALGLTSIFFAFLFEKLCIPQRLIKTKKSTLFTVFVGWSLSLVPYLMVLNQIIFTKHYRDIGSYSVFQIMNIFGALAYWGNYLYRDFIPLLFPNSYLSVTVFLVGISLAIKYRKRIQWKTIAFFFLLGVLLNLIIYIFRVTWGKNFLGVARYDVLPVFMFSCIYVFLLKELFKDNKNSVQLQKYDFIICLTLLLCGSWSGAIRHRHAERAAFETSITIQRFSIQFRYAFLNYFRDHGRNEKITIKNTMLFPPTLPSLATKRGGYYPNLTRYPRTMLFYIDYLLPREVGKKVLIGEKTDELFLSYLTERPKLYEAVIPVLK